MGYVAKYVATITLILVTIIVLNQLLLPICVYAASLDNQKETLIKGTAIAVLVLIIARIGKSLLTPSTNRDSTKPPLGKTYPDNNLDWLAHIIHGEARGEPFEGQVAVAAVVLNRVKDSRFPNTIKEVILAQNQFTAVADGQFYMTPNESSYKAAQRALSGEDPSRGALFFYNPKTARNVSWFKSLKELRTIGSHVFLTYK